MLDKETELRAESVSFHSHCERKKPPTLGGAY
jgi:hypothetical protein